MPDLPPALENVAGRLGSPAFSCEHGLIYRGDCLELMEALEDSVVDLTVTSPPYNIGKEYETPRELGDYLNWSQDWIAQVHRITRANGAFWLNLGYVAVPGRGHAVPLPYLVWNRVPFFLLQEVVWNYGAGVSTRAMFAPRNEKFLWFVKDPDTYTFNLDEVRDPDVKYPYQKKNGKLRCNPNGKNPTDVWQLPKVTSGKDRASKERTPHPAQFPLAVVDRIVGASSDIGDVVLDPFLGSGSLAEAVIRSGRFFLGFEIRADYVEIASTRLQNVYRELEAERLQRPLFELV